MDTTGRGLPHAAQTSACDGRVTHALPLQMQIGAGTLSTVVAKASALTGDFEDFAIAIILPRDGLLTPFAEDD